MYRPARIADATDGPIGDAEGAWPALVSPFDVFALVLARGAEVNDGFAAALVHTLLLARTGGYHARLPRVPADVRGRFERLTRPFWEALPAFEEAMDLLADVGAIESGIAGIALVRPPAPTVRQLRAAVLAQDSISSASLGGTRIQRLVTDARIRLVDHGPGARAWEALIATDRLRIAFRARERDPDPIFSTPPGALAAPLPPMGDRPASVAHRGGVPASALPAGDRPGEPMYLGEHEIAALLLRGAPYNRRTLRRVLRATRVWLELAGDREGTTGPVERTITGLARDVAEVLELDPSADNRKTILAAVDELIAIGALSRRLDRRGARQLVLHRPPGPPHRYSEGLADAAARWRLEAAGEPCPTIDALAVDGRAFRERHVRDRWFAALAARSIVVEVTDLRSGSVGASRVAARAA
ncbi:hypothetical protein AB0L40_08035 [Patulibacter sp. NPDC049589]|uniref:hypothetical protein n=1 Tax=Patulibacter sp. NPDC049589 TaxID=3154731 RepID=UPI003434A4A8